jgi:hypothetical protein
MGLLEKFDEIRSNKIHVPTSNSIIGIQELESIDLQDRATRCASLGELFAVLNEFSKHQWSIQQQADMSAAYTPIALRLIEVTQADKWKTLEHLACLCWSKLP